MIMSSGIEYPNRGLRKCIEIACKVLEIDAEPFLTSRPVAWQMVLFYLIGQGADKSTVAVSKGEMCERLDLTEAAVDSAIKRLKRDRVVEPIFRYAADKSQLSNSYQVDVDVAKRIIRKTGLRTYGSWDDDDEA